MKHGHRALIGAMLAPLIAVGLVGCAGRPLVDTPLSPPLNPAPSPGAQAAQWYFAWEAQGDLIEPSGPQGMLLICSGEGREWRSPSGPDGYVVRVVLLDAGGRPVRSDGEFQAFLVHEPAGPDPDPLLAWSVPKSEATQRYHEGITAGYLLELDWGTDIRPPRGQKMLVIRWLGSEQQRITRNVAFEDRMEYGIETQTERP